MEQDSDFGAILLCALGTNPQPPKEVSRDVSPISAAPSASCPASPTILPANSAIVAQFPNNTPSGAGDDRESDENSASSSSFLPTARYQSNSAEEEDEDEEYQRDSEDEDFTLAAGKRTGREGGDTVGFKSSPASSRVSQVKIRHRTTQEQLEALEAVWQQTHMPSSKTRQDLATMLSMTPRRVQIWFQNKRAKLKKGLTDSTEEAPMSRSRPPIEPTADTEDFALSVPKRRKLNSSEPSSPSAKDGATASSSSTMAALAPRGNESPNSQPKPDRLSYVLPTMLQQLPPFLLMGNGMSPFLQHQPIWSPAGLPMMPPMFDQLALLSQVNPSALAMLAQQQQQQGVMRYPFLPMASAPAQVAVASKTV